MVFGLFGGEKKRNQQLWAEVVQAIAHQDKEGLRRHAESRSFASLAPNMRWLAWAVFAWASQAGMTAVGNPELAEQLA